MTLQQLIDRLSRESPDHVCKPGFGEANSYRGYYEQIAFEPEESATVAAMLERAQRAKGAVFHGYKGGAYRMYGETIVNIAEYGRCGEDDELSDDRLNEMLGWKRIA